MSWQNCGADRSARRLEAPPTSNATRLLNAATLLMFGTLLSSVLGMLRLLIINALFGQTGGVGAFFAAIKLSQTLFDFLLGGAVTAALIPLFVARQHAPAILRAVLWPACAGTGLITLVLWLLAPWLIPALNPGFTGATLELTIKLARIAACTLPLMAASAILGAWLVAMRRQFWTALAVGIVHLGVIGAALLLGARLGVLALALGLVLGTGGQALVLAGIIWRAPSSAATDPPPKRGALFGLIARRYAPVALGLILNALVQNGDQWVQSQTVDPATGLVGGPTIGAMASATALIQFPVGLVAAALALAALPDLVGATRVPGQFAAIARLGLRLGIFLMIPIVAIFLGAAEPIVALLFQHGAFTTSDTTRTALALRGFAPELVPVAIEQVLIAVCFARGWPHWPTIAAGGGALAFGLVALPFAQSYGILALALANTAQHTVSAVVLLVIVGHAVRAFWHHELLATTARSLAGGIPCLAVSLRVGMLPHATLPQAAITAGGAITAGALVYLAVALALRAPELDLVSRLRNGLRRSSASGRS